MTAESITGTNPRLSSGFIQTNQVNASKGTKLYLYAFQSQVQFFICQKSSKNLSPAIFPFEKSQVKYKTVEWGQIEFPPT